jgi:hypothetical protein
LCHLIFRTRFGSAFELDINIIEANEVKENAPTTKPTTNPSKSTALSNANNKNTKTANNNNKNSKTGKPQNFEEKSKFVCCY